MSKRVYTVEVTYALPVYKHVRVEASSAAQACELALQDQDWNLAEKAFDESGEPFVSGLWAGAQAYLGRKFAIPARYQNKQELAWCIVRDFVASSFFRDDLMQRCSLVGRRTQDK